MSIVTRKRSLTKAVTYRILIVILDFTTIYLLTSRIEISLGFTIVSNVYTSIAYYLHERIWNKTDWGRKNPSNL
ncbi:MAG TPA: DUF2061 domain-containing protein [Candidatus Bathyarchaeia archaeon]|nr:DUF2061 domain-containing protein [Candidatus Bathyarchaeia archaeon]